MTHHIHQELEFPASPERIYAVLTDAQQFQDMTGGAPTEIDPTAGGAFSCFGGMILGRTIECEPHRRLVQAWRAKTWTPGVYSIVRFELTESGESTKLTLDHTGFPDGQAGHLEQGWYANYWEPLRKLLS